MAFVSICYSQLRIVSSMMIDFLFPSSLFNSTLAKQVVSLCILLYGVVHLLEYLALPVTADDLVQSRFATTARQF